MKEDEDEEMRNDCRILVHESLDAGGRIILKLIVES
jgi:hypothetical protein